jgi:hypothetical protein
MDKNYFTSDTKTGPIMNVHNCQSSNGEAEISSLYLENCVYASENICNGKYDTNVNSTHAT